MSGRRGPGHAPARFDEAYWSQDLQRASVRGRAVALAARARYERDGVPVAELRRLHDVGDDGTQLPGCVKVYLPPPAGQFGMVFQIALADDGAALLLFLAFGVRHHPARSRAPTVYRLAHRRLAAE
jgi:hypothetical protein